jgi:uncharacterized SAM-binding protein YcdF (DUF218 family)
VYDLGSLTYIVIACHFASASELCQTTIARLLKALAVAKKTDKIVVTGDVPYEPGTPTLGRLMSEWLIGHGILPSLVIIHKGGVGTFSEARLVCASLKSAEEIVVISSPWHIFQAKPVWERRALENKQTVRFISVQNTGGWVTWATYITLGLIIRGSILLRLERVLEDRFTDLQQKRRNGFKLNGCR